MTDLELSRLLSKLGVSKQLGPNVPLQIQGRMRIEADYTNRRLMQGISNFQKWL